MTFTATYRDRTGAMREERVEAASRSEAVAALKAQGIVPMRVEAMSGAKAQRRRPQNGESAVSRRSVVYVIAAVFVLLAVGGLWWWLGGVRGEPALPPEKPNATSAATSKKIDGVGTTASHVPPAPSQGMEATVAVDGRARSADRGKAPGRVPAPGADAPLFAGEGSNAVFKTASDQILSMLEPADGTGAPPPPDVGPDIERQFLESLRHEITILDTDGDDVRAMKQAVIEARAEMKRLVDGGMSVGEIIREHQRLAGENAAIRREVMGELNSIIESGDTDAAVAYRKRINAALEQMGIAPLKTAITAEERATRAEERRERRRRRLGDGARGGSGPEGDSSKDNTDSSGKGR